jgi:FeS assembly ATPase SufC
MIVRIAYLEGNVKPADLERFDAFIASEVVPLMKRFPGVRSVRVMRAQTIEENGQPLHMTFESVYDSVEAMNHAFTFPVRQELKAKMAELSMDTEFARRYVNDGFSGGEMKRAEILQLAMLRPKFAVLDETDSGLDADAVRLASQSIARIGGAEMGILIITHHEQLLEHNTPLKTHVMLGGRIVESGGPELAQELHKRGYERIRAAYPDAAAAEKAMEESAKAAAV